MGRILFTVQLDRDELRIETDDQFGAGITLDCNLAYNGSPVFLELPRRYKTVAAAKSAAARLMGVPLAWVKAVGDNDPEPVMTIRRHKPRAQPLAPVATLEPGEDLNQLRAEARRYRWLRERAVRVQGSNIWYQGDALDVRVDVGLDRVISDQ